jgi:hypothetical protein
MWLKLGQLVLTYLILPLAQTWLAAVLSAKKIKDASAQKLKDTTDKIRNYTHAKTPEETDSTFDDLP